jgi:putative FmdB family regulatory protein
MPTYEYICRACGHEFEEFQSIKADPIAVCPKCRKKKVERKIGTGGAVIFKGGGFYETDYRSEGYKSAADAEKKAAEGKTTEGPAESKSGEKSEASSKAKPEAKSEAKSEARSDAKPESKPAPKPDSKPDAAAAAAENKRIESRATHQSRIGRGVGNIVKKKAPAKKKR